MFFTYQNHLKYTISGREYGYRETPIEKFVVSLGAVDADQYRTSSFEEELHRTAQLVREDFGKDLILFLSGGTDSEIVLRNFIHNGFKPQCAVIRFENNYNAGEVADIALVQIIHTNAVNNTGYTFRILETYADGFDSYNQTSAVVYMGLGLNQLSIPTYHKLIANNLNTITIVATDNNSSAIVLVVPLIATL